MKKLGIKLVAYGAFLFIANNLLTLAPAINNQLAMTQLENDNFSLLATNMLNRYEGAVWLIVVLIGILLFQKDIRNLFKKGIKDNEQANRDINS